MKAYLNLRVIYILELVYCLLVLNKPFLAKSFAIIYSRKERAK